MTQPHYIDREAVALVEKLRAFAAGCRGSMWQSRDETIRLCDGAADLIESLSRPMEAVAWREKAAEDLRWSVYTAAYAVLRDYDNHPSKDRGLIIAGDQRIPNLIADSVVSRFQALAVIPTEGGEGLKEP